MMYLNTVCQLLLHGLVSAATARFIKKTKKAYYEKRAAEANSANFWDLVKGTKGVRQYPSPPISRGEGLEPALLHADKCEVLRSVLLPPPPQIADPPAYDLEPHPEDMDWHPITREEVRKAIFDAKAHNAPGISDMTGAAMQTAWSVASEEIFAILSAAARTGYHPERFKQSICIAIRKAKKPNYSLPNAYRPIQLLEVMGKSLERIQADRIAFLAEKHNLIPPLHFGGVKGKSAEDAVLCAVHDIQAAKNHGLVSSSLTFDISGFFNNISHPVLLSTMRKMRLPLPIVRWVESFLTNRQTIMCLDGQRDTLKLTETGTPQGSPVSGILAAIATASLTEELRNAMHIRNPGKYSGALGALGALET